MAIVLLVQSAGTLCEVAAQEKPIIIWQDWGRTVSGSKLYAAMKDINATAYFIMLGNEAAIQRLESFLAENKKKGLSKIDLFPFYGSTTPQFGTDHKAFAAYMANLSLRYPSLMAYGIDDFIPPNYDYFKPQSVKAWMDAKDAINPKLKFLPVLYYDVRAGLQYFKDGNPYKPVLRDGTTMWYWASYRGQVNLKILNLYITEAKKMVTPATLITGLYPVAHDRAYGGDLEGMFHHPDTLRKMLRMSLNMSDGVYLYGFPFWLYDTTSLYKEALFKQHTNDNASFDYKLYNDGRTFWTWYQAVTTTISLPADLKSASVQFKIRDNAEQLSADVTDMQNRRYKQLVVNGKVLWDVDLYDDGTSTQTINKDVLQALKGSGSKGTIAIRYIAKLPASPKNAVYVGDIDVKINGSSINSSFKFESDIAYKSKWMETYNIVKEVFGAGPGINNKTASKVKVCEPLKLYANTFGKLATVGYQLPAKSRALLRIYDVAGNLLTTLVNREMRAGYHSVKWDRSTPSVYFVNLKAGENSVVKRMVGF